MTKFLLLNGYSLDDKLKEVPVLENWKVYTWRKCFDLDVKIGDIVQVTDNPASDPARGVVVKVYPSGKFYMVTIQSNSKFSRKLKTWERFSTDHGYYSKPEDWVRIEERMVQTRYDYLPVERVILTVIDGIPRQSDTKMSSLVKVECYEGHGVVYVRVLSQCSCKEEEEEYGAVELVDEFESAKVAMKRAYLRAQISKLRYKGHLYSQSRVFHEI